MIESLIASNLKNKKSEFHLLDTAGTIALGWRHKILMKWDWDLLMDNGASTGHTEDKTTITYREEPREIVAAHPWTQEQVWAFFDSFGGVNAYCLTKPMFLVGLSRQEIFWLRQTMGECRVDPTYIQNLNHAQISKWAWCSRVWPQGRPQETYTGKFKYIWAKDVQALNSINARLKTTLWDLIDLYDVHNQTPTDKENLSIIIG